MPQPLLLFLILNVAIQIRTRSGIENIVQINKYTNHPKPSASAGIKLNKNDIIAVKNHPIVKKIVAMSDKVNSVFLFNFTPPLL